MLRSKQRTLLFVRQEIWSGTRGGYDLKSLAWHYGLAGEEAQGFAELFGAAQDVALKQFDSPDLFPKFALYAARDAVYTYKLFHLLRETLHQTSGDRADGESVAEELRRSQRKHTFFTMPRQGNAEAEARGAAGTSGSVQLSTGKTMWDFYNEHLSSRFSECLVNMQERGILLDSTSLQRIEHDASADFQRLRQRFQELLREIRDPQGHCLNPDADKMNLNSSMQLRTLLFGGRVVWLCDQWSLGHALLSRAAWGSDLAYVVRPEGCAYDRWTDPCRGGASCQTLAEAGLTCSGIMDIDGCDTACSYPCCVATTTLTHTETMTHTTATATATHTETVTTATITATLTDTATATSTETVVETTAVVATTETVHHEHHVVTNSTTEEVETTAGPSTRGPAAVMKLTMRVEVRDMEDYREYFEDPLIRQAYINVMSEVSTVPKEQLQVEMSSEELGYIMVTYIMTIPYSDGEPSLPMAEIQEKLSSIDMPTFNELLDKEISEVAGEGKYQQKVVSVNVADVPVNAAFQHHVPKAVLSAFAVLLAGRNRKFVTAKGWPSTCKDALEALLNDEDNNVRKQLEELGWSPEMVEKAAEAMQVHRQMASVKNVLTAFAKPMQEHASTQGRLHPSWSYGTSTGRLSCSNPNLQALPSPEKDSYKVRSALKAADGHTFILADYSQLELRILAPDAQSFAWSASGGL
eukprot:g18086.t1